MILTQRVKYGLILVDEISKTQDPIQLHKIANKHKLSRSLLEQVTNQLRKSGLLRCKRGPGGGVYEELHRPATQITVLEVGATLDTTLADIKFYYESIGPDYVYHPNSLQIRFGQALDVPVSAVIDSIKGDV